MNAPATHDPYKIRGIEQLLSLLDQGDFLIKWNEDHFEFLLDLLKHRDQHGGKTKGTMTLVVNYEVGKQHDLLLDGTATFKAPKSPPSSAGAFISETGELTLYSPLMARMRPGPRDAKESPHDPETGEVRDA